jgi:hypothetical protein
MPTMSEPRVPLRLADPIEIAGQIAGALRDDERDRRRPAAGGAFLADRTAEAVLRRLERGGYVIMKAPQPRP